ncbi:MAG: pseudouridine synthase [Lysobacteraceae bacterium]
MTDTSRPVLSLKRDPNARVEERLHKVLAQAGLGSRRALEERIVNGQVRVNGEVAELGSSLRSGDRVELDGRGFVASAQSEPPRVLLYHKPEGELTTREDPEGRPTVFDKLPAIKGARWIAVGRLDINTTGLLLLTTDGDLANALMHPSAEISREYVCRIHGEVSDDIVKQLARGVTLEDGPARFDEIERIGASDSHAWFRVVLHEGRNREVRRMWEAVGFQVSRLKRVRYGSIELPRLLRRGQWQELPAEQSIGLRRSAGLGEAIVGLTLQPVIHQRRAKGAEYRPAPREQRAWTGADSRSDEGRELRAFDNLREERPSRPGGRGKKPFGKGPRSPRPDNYGNTLTAPAGQPRGGKDGRRGGGARPGFENPTEFRSWYVPEGVTTTSPGALMRPGKGSGKPRPAGKGAANGQQRPGGRPGTPGKPAGANPGRPGGFKPRGPKPGAGGPRRSGPPRGPRGA